jgi:type 1 fimbriae regulatory protein FimB
MGPQRAGVIDTDASSITKGNLILMPAMQTAPKPRSAEQVKAILKVARQHSTRDWCLLLLTFRHALRSSEARTLKLADIDLENCTIAIARVKGSRSGVQSLDRHRGEPGLDEVLALRSWLRERAEDGSRILFPSQKGGAMTRMTFLWLFRKYALAVGVSREMAHPHILRHSLCSTACSAAIVSTRFNNAQGTKIFPTR